MSLQNFFMLFFRLFTVCRNLAFNRNVTRDYCATYFRRDNRSTFYCAFAGNCGDNFVASHMRSSNLMTDRSSFSIRSIACPAVKISLQIAIVFTATAIHCDALVFVMIKCVHPL